MYLFWVTFIEKPRPTATKVRMNATEAATDKAQPPVDLEARLNWSEYLKGEWSTRESSGPGAGTALTLTDTRLADVNKLFVHVSKEFVDGEEGGVFVHLVAEGTSSVMARMHCPDPNLPCEPDFDDPSFDDPVFDPGDVIAPTGPEPTPGVKSGAFYLAGRNSSPVLVPVDANDSRPRVADRPTPRNPYSAQTRRANRYLGSTPLTVTFKQRITTESGTPPEITETILPILGRAAVPYSILPSDNRVALEVPESAYEGAENPEQVRAALQNGLAEMESLIKPVFYQDGAHTFLVEPEVAERTVEQWESWVQPPPNPHPFDAAELHDWRIAHVRAQHPDAGPAPGAPPASDWLVNRGTLVRFDDRLIGPRGQVPLTFEPAAPALARPGMPVRVNSAGGVDAAEFGVLGDGLTLEQVGLAQPAGGLHVLGAGGVNAAMMNRFSRARRDGSRPGVVIG
jgi:hypothetical protein